MGGWLSSLVWGEEGDEVKEKKIVMVGLDNAGKTTILYKLVERDESRRRSEQPPSSSAESDQQQASLLSRFFIDYGSSSSSSFSSSPSPSPSSQSVVNLAPTIGFQVEAVRCGGGGPVLAVWDVGGQTRLRQMWPICYTGAAAAVFVVDAADLRPDNGRLSDAREALRSLLSAPELRGAPLLLLANKSDDQRALGPRRVLEALGLLTVIVIVFIIIIIERAGADFVLGVAGGLCHHSNWPIECFFIVVIEWSAECLLAFAQGPEATCGLTGEGLEEGFKWLADTLSFVDEQREAQDDSLTRWS
ncbi:ADPribosylation factor subfamily protein [Acanthamoeba castellanii str. Neff]|uniref:ADPribosylation factor subfamily protein n=1 Tax=Acanthamoeba castellanii (strain ATCC 30010 / Neff) TaxID=1257118 RepID=L8GKS2_ACACF|nr:ADPribosylation factor subfamily protein [Acanthamoeba castellanii str. Neff]ELR12801.1 ADPribosylation factor subfamily protein [Acanthamoeba castellanii str. Neff]